MAGEENVFAAEPEAPMVWLEHSETHGRAQFPAAAVEAWSHLGWRPCDAPPEVDPALLEHVPAAAPAAPEPPAEAPATEPATARKSTKGVSTNG